MNMHVQMVMDIILTFSALQKQIDFCDVKSEDAVTYPTLISRWRGSFEGRISCFDGAL
jgi:hypothetical protein